MDKSNKVFSDRKKGYLFVIPWSIHLTGGVNRVVTNLYDQMKEGNVVEPILLINEWEVTNPISYIANRRLIVELRIRNPLIKKRTIVNLLSFIIHLPISIYRLFKLMKKFRVNVINPHFPDLSTLNYVLMSKIGLFTGKVVLSLHGSDLLNISTSSRMEKLVWRYILRNVDIIIVCSRALSRMVLNIEQKCKSKIRIIHNGIDINRIQKERDLKFSLPKFLAKKKYILNIGMFKKVKGQDVLIRAFYRIAHKYSDIDLVLVGQHGDTIQQLRILVNEFKLADRIFFFENQTHSRASMYMENSLLFVLPSRNEGLPIVILEAGAFSIPVIASDVGGVNEIISDCNTGILVCPDNYSMLADKIIYLLENDSVRTKLGGNLHDHVKRKFILENVYRKYLSCCLH